MLKAGDIVMICPKAEDNEVWFEHEETWGCWGEVMEACDKGKYPFLVDYIPWNTAFGLCSEEFSKEELTHLQRMHVR